MKFLIGAVHCIVTEDGQIILDPDYRQTQTSVAQLTFVYDSVDKNTVAIHTSGRYTIGQYNDALVMCREASDIVFSFYKNAVKKFAKVL